MKKTRASTSNIADMINSITVDTIPPHNQQRNFDSVHHQEDKVQKIPEIHAEPDFQTVKKSAFARSSMTFAASSVTS